MVYTIVVHLYAKEGKEVEEKLRNKLIEASQVYSKDIETIGWHVMQDHQDPRKWCIVERYEHESSQKYHLENPYWKTFDPYVWTSRWTCAVSTSWTRASPCTSSKRLNDLMPVTSRSSFDECKLTTRFKTLWESFEAMFGLQRLHRQVLKHEACLWFIDVVPYPHYSSRNVKNKDCCDTPVQKFSIM
ncbi:ABM domain-containing protein [Phytophthora infestans]|uniref:ABM domain-containing protein n=1 Tax=Phytophthora infestans TaxID=4787 RepID=A0A8S9UNX2_PHYIN|nr:ABM domain-containing protein [Phytophthora infestans]